jgi:hypothetical protein
LDADPQPETAETAEGAPPTSDPAELRDTVADGMEEAAATLSEPLRDALSDTAADTTPPSPEPPTDPGPAETSNDTADAPPPGTETADTPSPTQAGPPPDWSELLSVERFDADALIAAVEATPVSRVTQRAAIAALEAARDTPELRQSALNQVRTLLSLR